MVKFDSRIEAKIFICQIVHFDYFSIENDYFLVNFNYSISHFQLTIRNSQTKI